MISQHFFFIFFRWIFFFLQKFYFLLSQIKRNCQPSQLQHASIIKLGLMTFPISRSKGGVQHSTPVANPSVREGIVRYCLQNMYSTLSKKFLFFHDQTALKRYEQGYIYIFFIFLSE